MNYKELQKNFREASDVYQQLINDLIFLQAQNEELRAKVRNLEQQVYGGGH